MGKVIKISKAMKANEVAKAAARQDGWHNVLTGMNIRGKDKRTATKVQWDYMVEAEADELYAASDVARKINDEVVEDAFREGYQLTADSLPPKITKALKDEEQRLQVNAKLAEAWKLARMYGGSGIIPMPRDLKLLEKPCIPESLPEIRSLLVLSRWELPRQAIETDLRSPNFGRPKSYRIAPRTGAAQMNLEVHHSWVIRFDGSYLPRQKFFSNNLWHDSILNTCKEAIRNYEGALAAVSAALDDFSVGISSMKDLARALSEDRDDLITKRLDIMNLSRSVARTIVIDADNEKFEFQNRPFTGVKEVFSIISGRLVVASNMPHTKILGESPDGSNATGNSTTKDWYDHCKSQQVNYLKPRGLTLWTWVLSAKKSPTNGKVPVGLDMEFAPLWQEPESVQADVRYKTSQADALDIQNGVLDPAEVAVSRFGSGKYSVETKLTDQREDQIRKPGDPVGAGINPEDRKTPESTPDDETDLTPPLKKKPDPAIKAKKKAEKTK